MIHIPLNIHVYLTVLVYHWRTLKHHVYLKFHFLNAISGVKKKEANMENKQLLPSLLKAQ